MQRERDNVSVWLRTSNRSVCLSSYSSSATYKLLGGPSLYEAEEYSDAAAVERRKKSYLLKCELIPKFKN